jgi:hypothetical protein
MGRMLEAQSVHCTAFASYLPGAEMFGAELGVRRRWTSDV